MIEELMVDIRPITEADSRWAIDLIAERWGSKEVVSKGVLHDVEHLPGLIAWKDNDRVGLLTYSIDVNVIEVVTLDSLVRNVGIGTALISHVKKLAAQLRCERIWLITTNDNIEALRFYQKRGFQLKAVHQNAIEHSRSLKGEIPEIGLYGIPIRDELELELLISS
jgi:ribosomal protein S18 acetylase RimI-like enzyme